METSAIHHSWSLKRLGKQNKCLGYMEEEFFSRREFIPKIWMWKWRGGEVQRTAQQRTTLGVVVLYECSPLADDETNSKA